MEDFLSADHFNEINNDTNLIDNRMLIGNPEAGMKILEFFNYINSKGLRTKLLESITPDSSFYRIISYFQIAGYKDHQELGKQKLGISIDTFLDELKGNENLKFTKSEIRNVSTAIDVVFGLSSKETRKLLGSIGAKFNDLL